MIYKKINTLVLIFLFSISLQANTLSGYLANKKGNEALKHYGNALEKQANEGDLLFNIGNAHYENQDYPAAIKSYQNARSKNKKQRPLINHNLGNAYFQEQKYQDAIKHYIQSLKQNPNAETTQKNLELALAYLQQQQQEQEQQEQEQQSKNQEQPQDQQQNKEENDQKKQDKNPEAPDKKEKNAGEQGRQPEESQPQSDEEIEKQQIKNFLSTFDEKEKKAMQKYHPKTQDGDVDIDW